jgi:putative DNA primase/helicase
MPGDVEYLPPPVIDFDPDSVPRELREKNRWVVWRYVNDGESVKKPPFQVDGSKAKVNDSSTWNTFESCSAALKSGLYAGVGIIMDDTDDIVGWDLDKCLNPDNLEVEPWARTIIERLNSYTEITPSGKGFRIFVRGKLPPGRRKGRDNKRIECYDDVRFLTITGNRWPNTPAVVGAHDATLWQSLFGDDTPEVERAKKKDKKFKQLWSGDWKSAGYPSQSEADLALCRMLVHRFDGDLARVDEEFRRSGLFRPKWDVDHHGGRGTYGAWTVQQASSGYKPRRNFTDTGNARRFVDLHRDAARYSTKLGWLVWDGSRFAQDELQTAYLLAGEVASKIAEEADEIKDDPELSETIKKWSLKCESVSSIRNTLALAGAQPEISIAVQDLDANPHLVNLQNGTLDTLSGDLREHKREDLLTKVIPLEFSPEATCPDWEKFLLEIMDGDASMVEYLQRVVGYTLTGVVDEQKFFLLYGSGRNGKSTFYKTLIKMMGSDYAKTFSKELVLKSKHDVFAQYERLFAGLFGTRMAIVPEWGVNESLNDDVVKRITGDDNMRGRLLYQESFEFESTSKLFIIGNHKPTIRGTDLGMWRRVQMVPFTVTISEERQDKRLKYKLLEQLPGILRWSLHGLARWRAIGLAPPPKVLEATNDYRGEQDVFGGFLDEHCGVGGEVYQSDLYSRYASVMEASREYVVKSREFIQRMRDLGYKDAHGTGNRKKWLEIHLIESQRSLEDM